MASQGLDITVLSTVLSVCCFLAVQHADMRYNSELEHGKEVAELREGGITAKH